MKKPEAVSNNQHRLGLNQSSTQWLQTKEKEPTQRSRALGLLQGHAGVPSSIPVCSSASSRQRCWGDDCCWGQTHSASRSSPLPSSHRLHQGSHSDYKYKQPVAGHRSGPLFTPFFFPSHCAVTHSLRLTILNTISKGAKGRKESKEKKKQIGTLHTRVW